MSRKPINLNKTIGITGGIGSGKSVVARILRCNGFYVYDCDSHAKSLMMEDTALKISLETLLVNDIFFPDGQLDRKRIASIIFNNEEMRKEVNGLVHAAVRNDILQFREILEGYFFIEAAILATGGISKFCDEIWMVEAPLEQRYARVSKRDCLKREEIEKRIKSQERELSLLEGNDLIIVENDDEHPLLAKILQMTDKITNKQTYFIPC